MKDTMKIAIRKWTGCLILCGLFFLLVFFFGCDDHSPTGPDPTETPQATVPPGSSSTPQPTPTPDPTHTSEPPPTATPSPRPTSTPSPTPPTGTQIYHGDTYWDQFGPRIGSFDLTISSDGTVEGRIDMYAYCTDPLAEKYFSRNFKTSLLPSGGFEYEYFNGDVQLGWETFEVNCESSGAEIEGSWSYYDCSWPPHGNWSGGGTWRAHKISG